MNSKKYCLIFDQLLTQAMYMHMILKISYYNEMVLRNLHDAISFGGRKSNLLAALSYCDGSDLVLCTVDGGLRAIVFLYVFL